VEHGPLLYIHVDDVYSRNMFNDYYFDRIYPIELEQMILQIYTCLLHISGEHANHYTTDVVLREKETGLHPITYHLTRGKEKQHNWHK
jgi:hypothetical protein